MEGGTAPLEKLGPKVENPRAGVKKDVAVRQEGARPVSDVEGATKARRCCPGICAGVIDRIVRGSTGIEPRAVRTQNGRPKVVRRGLLELHAHAGSGCPGSGGRSVNF